METYVYKRRADGTHVINLRRTWEKLVLAARAVVAIENPADVFVISSRPFGQRAVLKFAAHTGATPIAGRFTPGAFTNQVIIWMINKDHRESHTGYSFKLSLAQLVWEWVKIFTYKSLHTTSLSKNM